jgi:AcrR family transcriptional regulator
MQAAVEVIGEKEPTPRQRAVLDAALRLLVEEGDAITMTAVARRANCSKETLYKWFGGRDGLLTATVQWQASKVRVAAVDGQGLDLAALTARLEGFASDWLKVISSDSSIALNRIAVAHAAQNKNKGGKDNLGAIVLENGRFALARRLKPVLEAGRAAGLLDFADAETVFRTFFGLVGRDVQIRLLLGDRPDMSEAAIAHDARQATRQFLTLFGAAKPGPRVRSL